MVCREYPPFVVGGVAIHTWHLVNNLRKISVDVHVVSFGNPKLSSDNVEFIEPRSSVLARDRTSIVHDVKLPIDIKRMTEYVRKISRDYNVVHVQEPYIGGLVRHPHLVTTIHDTSFGEIKGYMKYSDPSVIKRIAFYIGIGYWMEFSAIAGSRVIIVPAYDVAWELLKVYKVPKNKLRIISNGVEEPSPSEPQKDVARSLLDISGDTLVIYSTGQHIGRKRFETLVYATKILHELGFKNFEVTIGGNGPLTPYLTKLARELGVADIIKFPGWVSEEQKILYYRAADIFVVTSEYEAGPLVLLEAGIRGLPLVVSNTPSGFMAMLRDGYNALKFQVGDPRDLAMKLAMLMEDEGLKNILSRRAEEFARGFTWSRIARQTLKVYEEVLVD